LADFFERLDYHGLLCHTNSFDIKKLHLYVLDSKVKGHLQRRRPFINMWHKLAVPRRGVEFRF
jgi:hypothetical protein